jgi:hypothetical protein
VDASGNVTGSITIPASGAVVGFFDVGSQTVALSNVINPAQQFFVFSAALFQVTSGTPKTHINADSVLAGTYESYPPGSATSTGRWVASLNQKVKEKDKEEKEKEVAKEAKDVRDKHPIKETAKEKERAIEVPPSALAADPAGQLQQLTLRLDALEQRLATGQPFISEEERPEVGDRARQDTGEQ